jgi:uncharacterized protein YxjI
VGEHALSIVGPRAAAERFTGVQRLSVRQRKKWLEILLSFEFRNSYDVYDESQVAVFKVQETSSGIGAFLGRMFLGTMRPFRVAITDLTTGDVVLELRRPWRFLFHRLDVFAGNGEKIGAIQRKWSWVRRIYSIEDAQGNEIATLYGPFLKPWTFEIKQRDRTIGKVQKRWSGLGKELFSDADNFGIDLGEIDDPTLKGLAFASIVLIDVVHFERAKN